MYELKGRKVGWATDPARGSAVVVYKAVRAGRCEGCGRRIEVGGRFVRRGMPGGGPRTFPFCADCEPVAAAG